MRVVFEFDTQGCVGTHEDKMLKLVLAALAGTGVSAAATPTDNTVTVGRNKDLVIDATPPKTADPVVTEVSRDPAAEDIHPEDAAYLEGHVMADRFMAGREPVIPDTQKSVDLMSAPVVSLDDMKAACTDFIKHPRLGGPKGLGAVFSLFDAACLLGIPSAKPLDPAKYAMAHAQIRSILAGDPA